MSKIFKKDPFDAVMQAYKKLYPESPLPDEIIWHTPVDENGEGACGVTVFEDGGKIRIEVSPEIPVFGAVEVLAHELAHVRVGTAEQHGPRWERCFERIAQEYKRIIKADEMTEEGVWADVPMH